MPSESSEGNADAGDNGDAAVPPGACGERASPGACSELAGAGAGGELAAAGVALVAGTDRDRGMGAAVRAARTEAAHSAFS